jgi:hypothetical protein
VRLKLDVGAVAEHSKFNVEARKGLSDIAQTFSFVRDFGVG